MANVPDEAIYSSREISHTAFHLYVCYCAHRNRGTGKAFPSARTVDKETGIHFTYVGELRQQLVQKQWILIDPDDDRPVLIRGFKEELLKKGITRVNPDGTIALAKAPARPPECSAESNSDCSAQSNSLGCSAEPNCSDGSTGCSAQSTGCSDGSNGHIRNISEPRIEPPKEPDHSAAAEPPQPDESLEELPKTERPKNPYYEEFASRYLTQYGEPYVSKNGDFVQLARLRKTYANAERELTPEKFAAVAEHYFDSDRSHTLADFCVNFALYTQGPRDRYGRPLETRSTGPPAGNGLWGQTRNTQHNPAVIQRFIDRGKKGKAS